jgi:hypothetical protein
MGIVNRESPRPLEASGPPCNMFGLFPDVLSVV